MILEEETEKRFGYSAESVGNGSKKLVVIQCDYCREIIERPKSAIILKRKKLSKDACQKCCYLKRTEIEITYGKPQQREEVKNKIKQANLAKYGCESYTQSEEFKKKSKNTLIEKYGVEHIMQNTEHKLKIKSIMLDKYGAEHALQNKNLLAKQQKTTEDKFGNKCIMKTQIGKELCKKKVEEKYGVDNVFKLQEFQNKAIQSRISSGNIKLYDHMSIKDWAEQNGYSYSHFANLVQQYGFEEASKLHHIDGKTSIENKIEQILIDLGIAFQYQFRIENRIADFYLPDHKIIIEADGNVWHSDYFNKDYLYHKNKRELYIKNGYRPLFFREDEINNQNQIIKSILINKIGKSQKIYARECIVEQLSKQDGSKFLKDNHLMGEGSGKIYALIYNNEILTILRVKRIKNDDWEISRFCNKIGYSIIGGYSKLISAFEKEIQPKQLITFVDLRYGSGEYLTQLGFNLKNIDVSFKWTNGKKVYHRRKFLGNDGYDKGYAKLWDCGQAKYVKVIN